VKYVLGRGKWLRDVSKCNQLQPSSIFVVCKLLKSGGQGRDCRALQVP
jgi:hypothetical protein